MAVARLDEFNLGNDSIWQNRVKASLLSACVAIQTENFQTTLFHRERSNYVAEITGSVASLNDAVSRHAFAAATDPNVISDATQAGTVSITSANADTQQALVTDLHLDTAISNQFNTFFRTPGF